MLNTKEKGEKTRNNTKITTLHSNNVNNDYIQTTPKPMATHFTQSNQINPPANPIRPSKRLQAKTTCK